jgi:hypothetical protein
MMKQTPPGCASVLRVNTLTCQQVTALLVEYVHGTWAPELGASPMSTYVTVRIAPHTCVPIAPPYER